MLGHHRDDQWQCVGAIDQRLQVLLTDNVKGVDIYLFAAGGNADNGLGTHTENL